MATGGQLARHNLAGGSWRFSGLSLVESAWSRRRQSHPGSSRTTVEGTDAPTPPGGRARRDEHSTGGNGLQRRAVDLARVRLVFGQDVQTAVAVGGEPQLHGQPAGRSLSDGSGRTGAPGRRCSRGHGAERGPDRAVVDARVAWTPGSWTCRWTRPTRTRSTPRRGRSAATPSPAAAPRTAGRPERRAVQDDRRAARRGRRWAAGCPRRSGTAAAGSASTARTRRSSSPSSHTSETAGALGNAGQPPTPVGKDGKPGTPGKVETGGVFRSDDRRHDVEEGQRPRAAAVLLRPDPRRPDRRPARLRPRRAVLRLDRRRQSRSPRIARTIHPDHHALWVNPKDPEHLIVGNDGGLYVSKDRGQTFDANARAGDQPVLRRRGGHPHALPRLRRACRTTAAGAGRSRRRTPDGVTLGRLAAAARRPTASRPRSTRPTRTRFTSRASTAG